MPKLFSISIEVEEVAVGHVMRQLHNMKGVAKLNLEMGGAKSKPNGSGKPHAAGGKPRKLFGEPGKDLVLKLLQKGKPLRTSEISKIFEAEGRSPHSANSLMHVLKNEGMVENKGDGFVLTKKMKDRLRHRKAAKHG
jgi:transposase